MCSSNFYVSSVESAWIALDKAVEELANAAQNLRKALREFILSLGATVPAPSKDNYTIPTEYAPALDDLLKLANSGMPATVIGDVLENTIETIKEKVPSHPLYKEAQAIIEKLHMYEPDEDISDEDKNALIEFISKMKEYVK